MKSKFSHILLFVIFLSVFSNVVSAEESVLRPKLVSPGMDGQTVTIEDRCPTFSWTSVNWASGYEIAVFKTDSDSVLSYEEISAYEKPVLNKRIQGQAFSWTPASMERLNNGTTYIWYVKATDQRGSGTWSEGQSFRIELPVTLAEVEEQIREKLKEEGMSDEAINNVFSGVGSNNSETNEAPGEVAGTEGTDNTFYGTNAGNGTMTGQYNSFFGVDAGNSSTSGGYNTFTGGMAGGNNTTGFYHAFFGFQAGYSNTTGNVNTFLGYNAGRENTTGDYNTFSGGEAGRYNTIGHDNTFTGELAGYYNTEGNYNTFSGSGAGKNNTTGNYNTRLGYMAGRDNTTGSGNVTLGYKAGHNETGSNKLYIDNSNTTQPLIYGEFDTDIVKVYGNLTMENTGTVTVFEVNRTDGATFKLAAGVANTQIGTISNHGVKFTTNNTWKMRLNASGTLDMADGGSYNGTWNDASSIEFKENIREMSSDEARYALEELNPVIYNYKKYKDEERAGFIAEHVPEIVANNNRKNLSAMDIVAVITKVVKEQETKIEKQRKQLEVQENLITELKNSKKQQEKINDQLLKRLERLEKRNK